MNISRLNDTKYDRTKGWIKDRRNRQRSWEDIRFAMKKNEAGLISFLENRVEEDDWPEITVEEWYCLVELQKEAEEQRLEECRAARQCQLNDSEQNLDIRVPDSDRSSWQLYRKHLIEDNGFEETAVDNIEASCLSILKRLRTKTEKTDPVRGLVVGNVQSGKTANMAGLMAMAADYGWNMFIVLSGTIENLRRQTQTRLYNDLHRPGNIEWVQLDHLSKNMSDPSKKLANLELGQHDKHRYLTVCLKNKKRLENLLEWLQSPKERTQMLKILLIDDEADQASIDTGDVFNEEERKAINLVLQNMVFCRDKKARKESDNTFTGQYAAMNYISYTATPYANCLNDTKEESLYPKNFIAALPVSRQYFGAQQIFGSMDAEMKTMDIVRNISDEDVSAINEIHSGNSREIPVSLQNAILWFLCAAAVMRYYGYRKPVSMLVHTSQKQGAHEQVAGAIREWFATKRKSIPQMSRKLYEEETARFDRTALKEVYPEYSVPEDQIWDCPPFDDIKIEVKTLSENISSIYLDEEGDMNYSRHVHLCIDNCKNNGVDAEGNHFRLAYPDPAGEKYPDFSTAFIVVGGNTLSRGLTLEGLVSTYFFRTVKQADTLMQMGRWFGYRKHYEILPRIWMTADTEEKFTFLADVDAELRQKLFEMTEVAGMTPKDYQLAIKTSPKTSWLMITAKNKMHMAELTQLSYSGMDIQLTVYSNSQSDEENNIQVTEDFINSIHGWKKSNFGYSWHVDNVPFEQIRDNLLMPFRIPDTSKSFSNKDSLSEWILEARNKDIITDFTIVVAGRQDRNSKIGKWKLNEFEITKVNRTAKIITDGRVNIGVLSNKMDYIADLEEVDIPVEHRKQLRSEVGKMFRDIRKDAGAGKKPLLVIYRIDKDSKPEKENSARSELNVPCDLIGISMVIPGDVKKSCYVQGRIVDMDDHTIESEG